MARTANVFVRVEPEIKEQAESILDQLGIPMSNAVGMFLRQIVIHRGIPFEIMLPSKYPLVMDELSKEQFDAELLKGINEIENGQVFSADDVEAEMRKMYSV